MKIVRHCLRVLHGLAVDERKMKEEEKKKPKGQQKKAVEMVDRVFQDRREVEDIMQKSDVKNK